MPVVPGHGGGTALHARPGPAAARDAGGRDRAGRLALEGGRRGAGPVPGLQGVPQRLPGGRGHGLVQVGVPAPPLVGPHPPARPLHPGRPAGLAAPDRGAADGSAGQRGVPPPPPPGPDPRTPLPPLATQPFTRWWHLSASPAFEARVRAEPGSGPQGTAPTGTPTPTPAPTPTPTVTLWPDTFTEYLAPETGRAAARVLQAAGLAVDVPRGGTVCCGLTYLSTGRLDRARTVLHRTLNTVGDLRTPVLVLEPSCAAALRTDLPALLPDDPRAARLAAAVRTFAETLEEFAPAWQPPRLDRAVAGQTHCHQHAVLGDAADRRLRERAGLVGELSGGCCGLAGNFGFEPGHHEVSVACAEEQLLPSLRAAGPDALVQADGFSCRTQIAQLGGVRARHLAELLAEGL
ncbi:(Fe-S)-binding protein [Streptomyces sp. MS1.HAVA.3]|uniref:(Fe-S)-binding protein n=1 Tax=Streptomyces caledonius TaxID=3134107 RepID=A0ABU8U7E1_9ACTN